MQEEVTTKPFKTETIRNNNVETSIPLDTEYICTDKKWVILYRQEMVNIVQIRNG